MARVLVRTQMKLPNGVVLLAQPCGPDHLLDKPKARYWVATRDGQTLGEFRSWQVTVYVRMAKDRYGRRDRAYRSTVHRESWVDNAPGETYRNLNTERSFNSWKNACRKLPMAGVKILVRGSAR